MDLPRTATSPRLDVLVVGSVNLDTRYVLPALVAPGETIQALGSSRSGGGKGANQALAAAQLGALTGLLAAVGPDAEPALSDLARADVDLSTIVRVDDVATGTAVLLVAPDDNSIVIDPGANARLAPAHVIEVDREREAPRVVLLQHEVPSAVVEQAVRTWSGRSTVILNPSPFRGVPADVVARVDLLVMNRIELSQLLGTSEPRTVDDASALLGGAGLRQAVVTLGADGVLVLADGAVSHIAGIRVDAVDTVGAGDAFLGALGAALAQGRTLDDSCRFAAAAGSLAVTVEGARNTGLTDDAVRALLDRAAS